MTEREESIMKEHEESIMTEQESKIYKEKLNNLLVICDHIDCGLFEETFDERLLYLISTIEILKSGQNLSDEYKTKLQNLKECVLKIYNGLILIPEIA